jgi:hypothetical protein
MIRRSDDLLIRSPRALRAAAALALVAVVSVGCQTPSTLTIALVTPQNDDPLAGASSIRALVSNPPETVTVPIGANEAVNLSLGPVPAGTQTSVTIEALDAQGHVVARGRSPEVTMQPASLGLTVYIARPGLVGTAPLSPLPSGRDRTAIALAPGFGPLYFGGVDAMGNALSDVILYDDFTHTLAYGASLPAPRADIAAFPTAEGPILLFGGSDMTGAPVADLSEFDPTQAPAGALTEGTIDPSLARAGAAIAPLGSDRYLVVGGTSAAGPSASAGIVTTSPQLAYTPLPAQLPAPRGAGVIALAGLSPSGPGVLIVGGGAPGAEWFDAGSNSFSSVPLPSSVSGADHGMAAAIVSSGNILVAGGSVGGTPTNAGWLYAPTTHAVSVFPSLLQIPRSGLSLAGSANDVIAAGGTTTDGSVRRDAEVLDGETFAPVAIRPLAQPRAGGTAAVLETGDVLLAGGSDGQGGKDDALEIYSPR